MMTGTQNRTSSGRPASAADRSRTAIRSVITAVMPTPPTASSISPGTFGTGVVYLFASCSPAAARPASRAAEPGVGITASSECRASNTRFR